MSNLFDYRFRTKVYPDSLYGKLCRFLKGKEPEFQQPEWKESEMVLEASSAYCLPLAFKRLNEIGKCSEAELKHCGRVSIHKLIMRVYFLAQVCGLEGELTLIPVLGSPKRAGEESGESGESGERRTADTAKWSEAPGFNQVEERKNRVNQTQSEAQDKGIEAPGYIHGVCSPSSLSSLSSPSSVRSHPPHYISNGSNGMAGSLAFESSASESTQQPKNELTDQELLHHQDDETFKTMFGE